ETLPPEPAGWGNRRYVLSTERAARAARLRSRRSPGLFLCHRCPLQAALCYALLLEGLSELNSDIGALVQGAPKEENKPYLSCCRYGYELNRRTIAYLSYRQTI